MKSCINCGNLTVHDTTYCHFHPPRDERLNRIEGSVNAQGFSGPFEAENLLSEDRRPSTLYKIVSWFLDSGYKSWPSTALSIQTQRNLTVNCTALERKFILIATTEYTAPLMQSLSGIYHERRYVNGYSAIAIKWNDWPIISGLLKEFYPLRYYDQAIENWTPYIPIVSSCPRTMALVSEGLYTSQIAINRGDIRAGEWIATKSGNARFTRLFKGSHLAPGRPTIANFGQQYIAPASIDNLETILRCEQPLDIKLEACARIWELIDRQEHIARTFVNRRQTELYDNVKLHKYVYRKIDSEPDEFDIFAESKETHEPILEHWKQYLNIMEPYSQQKIMCEASWHAKFVSWWVDMRVGKTPAAMMIMARALKEDLVDHFLIVAPSINLYDPWVKELEKQGRFRICVLDTGQDQDETAIKSEAYDIYIISYTSLPARLPIMQWFWSMERVGIIADETSMVKNPASQRAKALGDASEHVAFAFALNGTPIAQGPQDVWAQQFFVDRGVTFGTNFNNFMDYWLVKTGPNKFKLDKYQSTLFELRLSSSSIRYIRSEADQFSGKDKNFRDIVMPPTHEMKLSTKEILNGYTHDENAQPFEIKACILTIYGHLRECCAGYNKYEVVPDSSNYQRSHHKSNPKVTWIKTFLKGNPGLPMIIYSENTELEEMIMKMLKSEGITYAGARDERGTRLTGAPRSHQIDLFQEGDARVFLMKSAQAKGVTLNRVDAVAQGKGAYPVIVYTQPTWSLIDWEQSQDRAVGTDPKTKKSIGTMIYVLAIKGSIEWQIINALRSKKKVQETLLADAERSGYDNPFSDMDLSGGDDGDEYFDAEEMEARYCLSLSPQKELSEKMIRNADVKYRATKYNTTQIVQKSRPISEHACYLMEKIHA